MTREEWRLVILIGAAITAIVVFLVVTLPASPAAIEPPPPSQWDDKLLALDEAALEQAYRQHVVNMFLTWMKDGTGQPARALNGVNQARRAYINGMVEIERRRVVPLPQARP